MSKLTSEDLAEIGKILDKKLEPIKADLLQIKSDLSIISKLNQERAKIKEAL